MHYVRIAMLAWSFRKEIGIVAGVLLTIILLPVLIVFGLLNSGVQAASDTLVSINPITHKVELKDINGNMIKTLDVTTTWPTRGKVTQEFGVPNPPYEASHTGIDIAAAKGEPISTMMAGTVIRAGTDSTGGLSVTVDHGDNITSSYLHLSEVIATEGQQVQPGDLLGKMGDTGWAFGVHVHFMIKVLEIPVNPRTLMIGDPNE